MRKVRRGYYEVDFVDVCSDPGQLEPGELTRIHTRLLERYIREVPELWLCRINGGNIHGIRMEVKNKEMARVAVIILNWNGEKLLREFLHSMVKYSRSRFGPGCRGR